MPAARDAAQYKVHLAALEWSLHAPIMIRDGKDIQSRATWGSRLEPYAHQVQNLITFCRRAPVALLADEVGLGKTISAGLILSELMTRRKVSRALVVAPRMLLEQWVGELGEKFGVMATQATGRALQHHAGSRTPVVVTTYQSLTTYEKQLTAARFDMVILDEAHKLRNLHGSSNPPQMAEAVRRMLGGRAFKYVLMLTATPIQNRLWDLYSLVDLLTLAKGHANPLGSAGAFEKRYFDDSKGLRLKESRRQEFRDHLSAYIARTRRGDAKLVFPTRTVKTVRRQATDEERELLTLVGRLFREAAMNALAQCSIGQALMSSPQALAAQVGGMMRAGLRANPIAQRIVSLGRGDCPSGKAFGLDRLINELQESRPDSWRLVVFTSRRETQEAIGQRLKRAGVPFGFIRGGEGFSNHLAVERFKKEPNNCRVLVSTDAGAEGVNLQVANVLVNYDLPWNPMVLEQRIGRVQRLASQHAEVQVLNLVLADSIEERVVGRLAEKLQTIAAALGDIEGILDAANVNGADGGGFEAMIRDLVVSSLKGLDSEQATRKAEASIEEGKRLLAEEKQTVDQTLGDLRDLHLKGPKVPDISPFTPSMPPEDFVRSALEADGGKTKQIKEGLFRVSLPGESGFRMTFSEEIAEAESGGMDAAFGGNAVRLYLPGKRDFERLAQSWVERSAAWVADRTEVTSETLMPALAQWLGERGIWTIDAINIDNVERGLAGELVCRASIAVAHDRLEKLVKVKLGDAGGVDADDIGEGEPLVRGPVQATELGPDLADRVAESIEKNSDLAKFRDFYRARLEEESDAARDPVRKRQLAEDLTARAAAQPVAFKGVRYSSGTMRAALRHGEHGPYPAVFRFAPSQGRSLRVEPERAWIRCDHSGTMAPAEALAPCVISGQLVLRHLLSASAVSGRLAVTEKMVCCAATGGLVLPEETDRCPVSGKLVRKGALAASALSGRLVSPTELVACEFTGDLVLADELLVSDISQRRYRMDQRQESEYSGRAGHRAEFVEVVEPVHSVAVDEAARSDVSGRMGRREMMVRSCLGEGRIGLPSEAVQLADGSGVALIDEVRVSAVSGKGALPEGMRRCEVTGTECLESELEVSGVSGLRFRCDQGAVSSLTGVRGHVDEFVQSVDPEGPLARSEAEQSTVSGLWVAAGRLVCSERPPFLKARPEELVRSAVSGKRVLPAEAERCALTGEYALSEEVVVCEFSGDRVLPRVTVRSLVSNRLLRQDRQRTSVLSGRTGDESEGMQSVDPDGWILAEEAGKSDVSGAIAADDRLVASALPPFRRALASEMVESAVSGRRVLPDEASQSEVSGRSAVRDEFVACEMSGVGVLPDEVLISEISGRRFRIDQSMESVLSGRKGHVSEFVEAEDPKGWIAVDESVRSDVSQRVIARERAVRSERSPHRVGCADEAVVSAATGKTYLSDEVVQSAISEAKAAPEEFGRCEFTGVAVLPGELMTSAVSGKRLREDEAAGSTLSGRVGHRSEFVESVNPVGQLALNEAAQSALSGQWAAKERLVQSQRAPHRLGLPSEMVKCDSSGQMLLRDEVAKSDLSGRVVDEALLIQSAASTRRALIDEMVICAETGQRVLLDETGVCTILGKAVDARLLVPCEETGRAGCRSRMVVCGVTGRRVRPSETVRCEVSNCPVLIREIGTCCLTGRRAALPLMARCPASGKLFVDDAVSAAATKERTGMDRILAPCQWTGEMGLAIDLEVCRLTSLRVRASALNADMELKVCRSLLEADHDDGPSGAASMPIRVREWIIRERRELEGMGGDRCIFGADGRTMFAAVRVRLGFLGLASHRYAVTVEVGAAVKLVCDPVPGRLSGGRWTRTLKPK